MSCFSRPSSRLFDGGGVPYNDLYRGSALKGYLLTLSDFRAVISLTEVNEQVVKTIT